MAQNAVRKIWHKSHTIENGRLIVGTFKVAISKISAMGIALADAPITTGYVRDKSPYSWPKRWFTSNPNPYTPVYFHGTHWDRQFFPYEWSSEAVRLWFDGNIIDILRTVKIDDLKDTEYSTALYRLTYENRIMEVLYNELEKNGVPS